MRVRVTRTAARRAEIVTRWWSKNRPGDTLFAHELEQLLERLATMSPGSPIGTLYKRSRGRDIWRARLKRSQQHAYYRIVGDEVEVIMIWAAQRGRKPPI